MNYETVEMQLDRYSELIDFWKSCEGIYVSDDDEYENEIIATVKCSHDGRRGYIHHLAVKKEFRKQGIARELVNKCIEILRTKRINKYRVFVLDSNEEALEFWKHLGFEEQVYNYRTFQMNTAAQKSDSR